MNTWLALRYINVLFETAPYLYVKIFFQTHQFSFGTVSIILLKVIFFLFRFYLSFSANSPFSWIMQIIKPFYFLFCLHIGIQIMGFS